MLTLEELLLMPWGAEYLKKEEVDSERETDQVHYLAYAFQWRHQRVFP